MTQTNLVKDTSRVQSARFAVEARGVKKVFGEGTLACHALRGIDFQVKPGEFVMLAGPSGMWQDHTAIDSRLRIDGKRRRGYTFRSAHYTPFGNRAASAATEQYRLHIPGS